MKDKIVALFEDYDYEVTNVDIDRNGNVKGLPAWVIRVDVAGNPRKYMEWSFAIVNHMNEDHMLEVMRSYVVSNSYVYQEGNVL